MQENDKIIKCSLIDQMHIFLCKVVKKIHLDSLWRKYSKVFSKKIIGCNYDEVISNIRNYSPKPEGKAYIDRSSKWNIEKIYDLQIIIPVYNEEKYIDNCIQSLLSQQTNYKWQAIIINDGSTDDTFNLLQKYKNEENIIILSQENKGFSATRNRGLELLSSKYVMFLDSDDFLVEGTIENLLDKAFSLNYDVVEGNYYRVIGDEKIPVKCHKNQEIENPINQLTGFPWGKVIKADLFKNIQYPESYWFEDSIISFLLYPLCKSTASIEKFVYNYRINPNGISISSKGKVKCIDTYWILEEMISAIDKLQIKKENMIELLFQHIKLSSERIKYLNKQIRKDVFLLFCYQYEKNFVEFDLGNNSFGHQCLEKKNISLFELEGRLYQ